MARLLAFALFADEGLAFGRGLSTDDEPESVAHDHHRLQPPHRRHGAEHGLHLRQGEAVGRTDGRPAAGRQRDQAPEPRVLQAGSRGAGLRVRPAADHGPRERLGVHLHAPGPRRTLARRARRDDEDVPRRGQDAPRDRAHLGRLPGDRPAGLRRHRPAESPDPGRADLRRQRNARGPPRELLRQRLQPVRPRLQGLHAGRARVPDLAEVARPLLREERRREDGPARHARQDEGGLRAPTSRPASTSTAPPS